jgi:DNA-binding response OmpR family regulator
MTEQQMLSSNVLIVEDERGLADLYAEWLAGEYTVRAAYNGKQAIEELGNTVDIVLLDRSLPDLSGDEILARIREQDFDCRVIMVTAVEPDLDILDLEFDDYLTKPVDGADLRMTIERIERLATHDDLLQELYQCIATRSVLHEENDISITDHESYGDLLDRIATLQEQVDVTIEAFDTEEFEAAFRDLEDSHSHD